MVNSSEQLATLLKQFDAQAGIREAKTPPASWYIDPLLYEAELDRVFRNNWIAVCPIQKVKQVGDYFSGTLFGEPFVVLRDEENKLRAFSNVCRHHAAIIASGCGNTETLVCPYHGWTYDLQGCLKSAPRLGKVKSFRREDFRLPEIAVEAWGPLVFMSLQNPRNSLREDLGRLQELFDPTGWDRLKFVCRREYQMNCNWKVFVDNYLDGGYHVDHLHQGLAGQLELQSYVTEIFERFSVQYCESKAAHGKKSNTRDPKDFQERLGDRAVYAWLYPNLMLNRYGSILDVNYVIPLAPERTAVWFDYFFLEPDDKDFVERSLLASDQVQQEDIAISEAVQKGMHSSSFHEGRYAPTIEQGEYHFHQLLSTDLQS